MGSDKYYALRQSLLRYKYGDARTRWGWENSPDGLYHDDRGVFCNIYDKLMEACEVMKGIENTSICVAWNHYCEEQRKILDEIYLRKRAHEQRA